MRISVSDQSLRTPRDASGEGSHPLLQMIQIRKSFSGVAALKGIDFELQAGEVHALVGENGAGKSTLIKILSGAQRYSSGKILLEGQAVTFRSPSEAQNHGIVSIYQELLLVEDLSVAENIFLGNEDRPFFNLQKSILYKKAQTHLNALGFNSIDARKKVKTLSVSEKQLLVIAKAIIHQARIIILDEPTATITDNETVHLFSIMRELKVKKVGMIFISHRLEEVFAIADRVTVLRDGEHISTDRLSAYSSQRLVQEMVGREIRSMFPKENHVRADVLLQVKGFSVPGHTRAMDITLHKGEILGVSGLIGSGKSELALALFGAIKSECTEFIWDQEPISGIGNPKKALEAGIFLIPEDRKQSGLVLLLSILNNITLPNTQQFSRFGRIRWGMAKVAAEKMIATLSIKTTGIHQKTQNLSGGNQQKVVLVKGLLRNPRMLIFAEPTRGIDVGAKVEVYRLMNELTDRGCGILMISSELQEVVNMCDRVMVLHRGNLITTLEGSNRTQEKILYAAMGEKE